MSETGGGINGVSSILVPKIETRSPLLGSVIVIPRSLLEVNDKSIFRRSHLRSDTNPFQYFFQLLNFSVIQVVLLVLCLHRPVKINIISVFCNLVEKACVTSLIVVCVGFLTIFLRICLLLYHYKVAK